MPKSAKVALAQLAALDKEDALLREQLASRSVVGFAWGAEIRRRRAIRAQLLAEIHGDAKPRKP